MRYILILFIRLYQKAAPARIRNSCRFEPTCSEYMALSIQKYGVRKGVKKGIDRLIRCKPPNDGLDYP
jgi:putative membrane protein insertion efficiency factor